MLLQVTQEGVKFQPVSTFPFVAEFISAPVPPAWPQGGVRHNHRCQRHGGARTGYSCSSSRLGAKHLLLHSSSSAHLWWLLPGNRKLCHVLAGSNLQPGAERLFPITRLWLLNTSWDLISMSSTKVTQWPWVKYRPDDSYYIVAYLELTEVMPVVSNPGPVWLQDVRRQSVSSIETWKCNWWRNHHTQEMKRG